MARILLVYSTVYGLSRRICETIQASLAARGEQAEVAPLADCPLDPSTFDAIVVGASIRHGKHHPALAEFVRRHLAVLQARPSAFFSVNLVARKPNRNTPLTNPYVKAFVAGSPWKPVLTGVFAGELDYARYGPVDRHLMRFVMWINRGPTGFDTRTEFTRWDEVERFAGRVAALAQGGSA